MSRPDKQQRALASESSTLDWPRANIMSDDFHGIFAMVSTIGQGSDGVVTSYQNRKTTEMVAVKSPVNPNSSRMPIDSEIRKLKKVGEHEHVVRFLSVCPDFLSGKAIILEYCDLGSVHKFREDYCENERRFGRLPAIPELTVLKLFRDMSLALDHLHNRLDTPYVHNDLKPENILVLTPPGHDEKSGLPREPIFKIADFARLIAFPGPRPRRWEGTAEYAPPIAERHVVRPPIDIWSLGCTIQFFALGILPTISRQAFIDVRQKAGLTHPDLLASRSVWRGSEWRNLRTTRYRPIDQDAQTLYDFWDVKHNLHHKPYSGFLNAWYSFLMLQDPQWRVTAEHLVKEIVPEIEKRMEVCKSLEQAERTLQSVGIISADGSFPPRRIQFEEVDGKLSTKWN